MSLKLKHAAAALCILMQVSSCSDQLSEGFVSDNNTCTPDFVSLADLELASPTTTALVGSDGLSPSAAQKLDVEATDSRRWGIQLNLSSDGAASGGLYMDLIEVITEERGRVITLPDGSIGEQILLSTVAATDIPTDPSGDWVTFQFSEIMTIKSDETYWIRLVPQYPATAPSPVYVLRLAGEDFAAVINDAWTISSSTKMAYRLITCVEL